MQYREMELVDYALKVHQSSNFPYIEMDGTETTFQISNLVWLHKCAEEVA